MELSSCLPEIFCIREEELFKVFENTIEQSLTYVNVLTPVDKVSPATLILCETPHQKIMTTFVRKWNGRHSRSCDWKFSGPYLKTLYSKIPLVEFTHITEKTLPYNSAQLRPVRIQHGRFEE